MMRVLHIKTLLATQRKQLQAMQLLVIVFYTRATRRGRRWQNNYSLLFSTSQCKIKEGKKVNKRGYGVECTWRHRQWQWWNRAHITTSDGTMELTLEQVMVSEMELCVLLLETLDTRVLGKQKCKKEKRKRGCKP